MITQSTIGTLSWEIELKRILQCLIFETKYLQKHKEQNMCQTFLYDYALACVEILWMCQQIRMLKGALNFKPHIFKNIPTTLQDTALEQMCL